MKVNYTLPGYQPETDVGKDVVESFDSPFKNKMQAFERSQPVGWRDVLGLNKTPPDPSQLAQPQGQAGQVNDAAAARQQWRNLLSRHGGLDERQSSAPPVRRMLTLLENHQKESDRMFARGLSETDR